MFYIIILYILISYTIHIQCIYNLNNHFKPVWTTSNPSVENDPRSSLAGTRHASMDENWLCPSVLGDVKGDAVFTYGLRKILKLLGFSTQAWWLKGVRRSKWDFWIWSSGCSESQELLFKTTYSFNSRVKTVAKLKYLLCHLHGKLYETLWIEKWLSWLYSCECNGDGVICARHCNGLNVS